MERKVFLRGLVIAAIAAGVAGPDSASAHQESSTPIVKANRTSVNPFPVLGRNLRMSLEETSTPTVTQTPSPIETPQPTITPSPEPTPTSTPEPEVEVEKPWTALAKITSYCLWGFTRLETPVRDGVIATDPRFIPLGSVVDIDTLGEDFVAEDTGDAVIGWHVDVWSSSCSWSISWGVQKRNIRVKQWG